MRVKPITNDGFLDITFSKKMSYPKSWIDKYEEDKLILDQLEKEMKSRILKN